MDKPHIPDEGAGVGGEGRIRLEMAGGSREVVAYQVIGSIDMPKKADIPDGVYHATAYRFNVKDGKPVVTIVVHLDRKASEE